MFPEKLNILLIEDNPADFAFLKTILSEEKMIEINLFHKRNIEDGIGFCREENNHIDVVLLDFVMRGSTGMETVKIFCKSVDKYPVILLTSPEDSDFVMKSAPAGIQDFIIKGEYERTLIIKSIMYSIERHKLSQKYEHQKDDLEQIEEKLKTIIANDLDAILVVDLKGVIKFSNPNAEKMFGLSSDLLYGRIFGIPVIGENNMAEIDVLPVRGEPIIAELQMTGISWQGADANLCTIRDISAQRVTEKAVKENEEKFMALARSSSDAIIHLDEQQNIVFVNSAAEKIFDFSFKDVLKIGLHYVFKNNPELIKLISSLGKETVKKSHIEITGFRSNEDSFPMEVSLTSFKRRGKIQTVCIIRDTTDRKRAESDLIKTRQQLEKSLKELKSNRQKLIEVEKLNSVKELAGAISHEFSQPLQALFNYLHLIQNVEPREEYFQKAREMLNRISELTTSLKNITSIRKMDYLESKIIDLFASSSTETKFAGRNILCVDDEREILETMIDIFKNAGYSCKGASDGREAYELIQSEKFDLVLCDVMMPRMSGVELLRKIRRLKYDIRFIFLTGYDIPENYKEISREADFIINKPVSFTDLLSYVDSALQN